MRLRFNKTLATAVAVVVTVAPIAGALVYLGMQLAKRPDETRVIALIEERLQQREEQAQTPAAKVPQAGRKVGELSEREFNARVERGIIAFLEKSQRAEQERPTTLARNVPPPGGSDHVYGNPDAPISLIEYSDFECPFCKTVHQTLKRVVDDSDGKVNWVYRHFPLDSHNPGAQKQAEASECAADLGGNDAFWKFINAVYARTNSGGSGFPLNKLVPLASEIGLDKASFEQCLNSGKHARKIRQQLAEAVRAGVNGTPGNILYLNKSSRPRAIALHGAQPYERFRAAVESLLQPAK